MQTHIYGGDKVPAKLLEIVAHWLEDRKHTVFSILFRDSLPDKHLGYYFRECLSISINVSDITDKALSEAQDEKNRFSFPMLIWLSLLTTFVHEMCHNRQDMLGKDCLSDEAEKEAKKEGIRGAFLLAKELCIEHPPVGPNGYWGAKLEADIAEFHKSLNESSDKPWEITQVACRAKGFPYYDYRDGSFCSTIRDLAKISINDGDARWDIPLESIGAQIVESPAESAPQVVSTVVAPQLNLQPQQQVVHPAPESAPQVVTGFETHMKAPAPVVPIQTEGDYDPELEWEEEHVVSVEDSGPAVSALSVEHVEESAPDATLQACVEAVCFACHQHIFDKCGYSIGGFSQSAAVAQPISIAHIPGASELFVRMDCLDDFGKFQKSTLITNGIIKGYPTKGSATVASRPKYVLTMNVGGTLITRSIMPVDPTGKDAAGNLKKWSQEAHQGVKRTMILDESNKITYRVEQINDGIPAYVKHGK